MPLAFFEVNQNTYYATANVPTKLNIYTSSPSVLADNNTYQCIFVQLQDSNGTLTRALQDITVGLSSSLITVGTVDSSITIPKGETFASANFTSTFNPGTTTISASATGFATVVSTITTLGPIPSAIAVYGFPSTLPADGNSYPAIIVQLQDSTSTPARAPPGGVNVALSCSNTAIGTVNQSVTILEGETYAIANFNTTTLAETQARILSVTITATSQGYAPNQVTITTTPVAQNPTKLKIFTGPPKVLADQNSYGIAVQLQNDAGYAAKSSSDTLINLASSDSSVCQIDSINIPTGQTYTLATLCTTYKPESASITAVANNFPLTSQAISTFGFIASNLRVYCIPSSLPADGNTHQIVQVQLQDIQGKPAINTGTDLNVKLYSSQPTAAVVSSIITIPSGKSSATGNVTTTYIPGNTTITAQASGYTTGQTTITTSLIDSYAIFASCGANGLITPNGTITVNLGGSQLFNATADIGYHISNLFVDNVSQGSVSSYTFANVGGSHTIFADFSINNYNLEVTQTANGVIAPETSSVAYGDRPTFTITPNEGYYITNIIANSLSVPVISSSGTSYQFGPVTANGSLTAIYGVRKIPIQVTQTANGNVTPGTTNVNYDGGQTFTITPKAGYHIVDVLVNGTSVGAVSTYTAQNIKGTTTISATFVPDSTPSPTPSPTPVSNVSSTVKAVTDDDSTVSLAVSGTITSQQMTNVVLTKNATTVVLSFTVTGENGAVGLGNITIPKGAVGYYETTPTIYIDGQPAIDQGSSQDTDNYYVWFTTHFSSHEVSIVFPSPTFSPQLFQPTMTVIIAVALVAAVTSSVVLILRKRGGLKAKSGTIWAKIPFAKTTSETSPIQAVSSTVTVPTSAVAPTSAPTAANKAATSSTPDSPTVKSVPMWYRAKVGFIHFLVGISRKQMNLRTKFAKMRKKEKVEQEFSSTFDPTSELPETVNSEEIDANLPPIDTPTSSVPTSTVAPTSEPIDESTSSAKASIVMKAGAMLNGVKAGFTRSIGGISRKRKTLKIKSDISWNGLRGHFRPREHLTLELRLWWREWRSRLRWKLRRRSRW